VHVTIRGRLAAILLAAVPLVLLGALSGCKGGAEFSQKEMEQFKQGPPKEMPAEARQRMQTMPNGPRQGGPGPRPPIKQ